MASEVWASLKRGKPFPFWYKRFLSHAVVRFAQTQYLLSGRKRTCKRHKGFFLRQREKHTAMTKLLHLDLDSHLTPTSEMTFSLIRIFGAHGNSPKEVKQNAHTQKHTYTPALTYIRHWLLFVVFVARRKLWSSKSLSHHRGLDGVIHKNHHCALPETVTWHTHTHSLIPVSLWWWREIDQMCFLAPISGSTLYLIHIP